MDEKDKLNKELLSWKFPEYNQYTRSDRWYIVFGVLMTLLLLYSFMTLNFLFSVIIILFAFILFIQTSRKPAPIVIQVREQGIQVGEKWYSYKKLLSFWLAYNPPETKILYIQKDNGLKTIMSIPLMDQDPILLREIMRQYLDEDLENEDETLGDFLGRSMKF